MLEGRLLPCHRIFSKLARSHSVIFIMAKQDSIVC